MKKKKVIVPNIVAGGTAVPLGSNYYLMRGRKHEEGGIDIGANPRTGLEVEDGEVMQLKDKEVRVFSTVPFLNGQSPAQKVMGGENPNKVFAQQEAYKDRNNINDDGTRKAEFGLKQNEDYVLQSDNTKVDRTNIQYQEQPDRRWVQQGDFLVNTETGERIQNSLPLERVYPEFDLLSLGKSFFNTVYKDLPNNMAYRRTTKSEVDDILENGVFRKLPEGKTAGSGKTFIINGKTVTLHKKGGNAHGGKAFAKGEEWKGTTSTGNSKEIIVGIPGKNTKWKVGHHGNYSELTPFENINKGEGLWLPFNDKGIIENIATNNMRVFRPFGAKYIDTTSPIVTGLNTVYNIMDRKGYGGNHPLNTKYKQKQVIDMKNDNSRTKAKAGLRYILQTNGKNKLGYVPSTGESLSGAKGRNKALFGTEDYMLPEVVIIADNKNNKKKKKKEDNKDFMSSITPFNNYGWNPNINYTSDATKDRNGTNPIVTRNAYFTPIPVVTGENDDNKDKDKNKTNWFKEHPNTIADTLDALFKGGASLASYFINKKALNKMKYDRTPIPRIAPKLKTNININPQLDKMRESLAEYERNIDANTASSQVALVRKQKARANALSGYNELYGYKENAETELINKDRRNQQEVANKSIEDYNSYLEKKMNFENAIREKKAENTVSLINNLASIPSDIISRSEKRRKEMLDAVVAMAKNPNVTPELLKSLGIKIPGYKYKDND